MNNAQVIDPLNLTIGSVTKSPRAPLSTDPMHGVLSGDRDTFGDVSWINGREDRRLVDSLLDGGSDLDALGKLIQSVARDVADHHASLMASGNEVGMGDLDWFDRTALPDIQIANAFDTLTA
jgi:hypothetical protein